MKPRHEPPVYGTRKKRLGELMLKMPHPGPIRYKIRNGRLCMVLLPNNTTAAGRAYNTVWRIHFIAEYSV